MNNQLTLGVSLKDEATFENFHIGQNSLLIDALKKMISEKNEQMIYFFGAAGEGRTHLLQATCHYANHHHLRSVYLPLAQLDQFSPELFEGLETLDVICVDDVQALANNPVWEEAFFHAYNRIYDAKKKLIITGLNLPKLLNLRLPDLVSRLSWGMVFQLYPLSDQEKLTALMMRAEKRGMQLSLDAAKFILNHCPRRMGELYQALSTLDQDSLVEQRKLTIPFIKEKLKKRAPKRSF